MIDYSKLSHAVLVAQSLGFKKVEVNWIIPGYIGDITRPENAHRISVRSEETHHNGELIASGETGLVHDRGKYTEPDQRLMTVTPCFRSEPYYTHGLYEPWFMKLELMIANPTDDLKAATEVMSVAKTIMGTWTRKLVFDPVVGDLMLNDIEVGSYGIRGYEDFRWAYGTGLAEPRFTYALEKRV